MLAGANPCLENKWYVSIRMGVDTSAHRQKINNIIKEIDF